jgi:hypothetical protein
MFTKLKGTYVNDENSQVEIGAGGRNCPGKTLELSWKVLVLDSRTID